jgi:hypothetical protein
MRGEARCGADPAIRAARRRACPIRRQHRCSKGHATFGIVRFGRVHAHSFPAVKNPYTEEKHETHDIQGSVLDGLIGGNLLNRPAGCRPSFQEFYDRRCPNRRRRACCWPCFRQREDTGELTATTVLSVFLKASRRHGVIGKNYLREQSSRLRQLRA